MLERTIPEGALRFNLEIRVDMREMKDWPEPCIREFFNGIARAQEATSFARQIIADRRASHAGETT
jgi:hypothetical protein